MDDFYRGHPQPKMKIHGSRSAKGAFDRGGMDRLIYKFYAHEVALPLSTR